jgi:hypothetical protein
MGVEGDLKLTKGDTQSTQTVGGPSGCFQPALETNQRGLAPAPRLRPPAPCHLRRACARLRHGRT